MTVVEVQPSAGCHSKKTVLWALIAVCALPVVSSWTLILNPELLPDRHSNHGTLIHPQIKLPEVALERINGTEFRLAELHGKWSFLMVLDGSCNESCRKLVYQLQQIRQASGKDRAHVKLLVLYKTEPSGSDLLLVKEDPGVVVAGINGLGTEVLVSVLHQAGVDERPGLVIIDPMGNLVMRYAQGAVAADILKDLKRLLRATRDWLPGTPEINDGSV